MIIVAVLSMCCIIIYTVLHKHNKFSYVLAMYFLSVISMLLVAVLYISKGVSYRYPFNFDYYMYLRLVKVKINISDISRLYNISISLFLLSSVIFANVLKKRKQWIKIAIEFTPILLLLIYYDYNTTRSLYIYLHSLSTEQIKLAERIINYINITCESIIICYMIAPFLLLITYYRHTDIYTKRKYAMVFGICLFFVNLFVYAFFIRGPFRHIMFYSVNIAKLPANDASFTGYIMAPALLVLVLIVVILLLFYYKPFNSLAIVKKNEILHNTRLLNKNMRMVLHAYKNAFLGIGQMSCFLQKNINEEKYSEAVICNKQIEKIVNEQMDVIEKTLSRLKNVNIDYQEIDIINCIESAIEKTCLWEDVKIEKGYCDEPYTIYGDEFHITEVFVNLFTNAVSAIEIKKPEIPSVQITTIKEEDMCVICVRDNGCGIKPNDKKNIFKMFYSSKPLKTGGGVGLNYVENVIKLHHGEIAVRSEYGKYSEFQVTVPLYSSKKSYLDLIKQFACKKA